MNKEYKIKLDLNKKLYNKKMAFNQFDENVNDFYIEVTKNNEVVKDLDKSIVTLVAIKPNGEVDAQFIEVKEGQIYADLKPSMCDLVGNYQAKAMIVLEGEIVTTDTINYSVNEDKIISRLNDDVVSDERFTLFTDALARLSTIEISEEQRMINEAERILAEENRKIEEAKRVEAELVRQHEEANRTKYDATRESNENIRKQNESIRLVNEANRIDEESKRVEEENKRKLAEEERNANYNFMTEDEERRRSEANSHKEAEVLRVQAETNRVDEEAKRRTTEQARVSAENTRVGNENTREASEVVRKNNETQRVEAETQRQSRYNSFITDAEANANNFENYTNTVKVKEEERKSNELDRKSQETQRVSNENERIANEEIRKANEVVREENEISRQGIFEDKVDEFNEKIVELNTTKENFVSSINTKVDNKISEIEVAKSDMTNTVSNKVNEVETRFNALTSKQQQSSEVIDARDGETSLKARLDRDIEKAKQVYVNVEGSHISTDSSVGYLKDVEILGNTIQSASNLADIRSVGDKVEGQELYEIPIQITNGLEDTEADYQEDKLTILSSVQLEKVGDVADRIIEKDGVWGVEKNIKTFHYNGGENWQSLGGSNGAYRYYLIQNDILFIERKQTVLSNKYNYNPIAVDGYNIGIQQYSNKLAIVCNIADFSEFKDSLKDGLLVKAVVIQPQFIPLPHDQQIKLRTFANKTNISFLTEIEGTIKAQVPKSLGATVNTHTEQINNLNKELDRVKKLEESTVSTVTTESDFTTVEATSNGYFEDVKLEGKTLVNLIPTSLSFSTNNHMAFTSEALTNLNPASIYTLIVIDNNLNKILDKAYLSETTGVVNGLISLHKCAEGGTGHPHVYTKDGSLIPDGYMDNVKAILLEGDHTQNPPSYFEGLKSVGQSATTLEDEADEIVVSSVNENLFDVNKISAIANATYTVKDGVFTYYPDGQRNMYVDFDIDLPVGVYSYIGEFSNSVQLYDKNCSLITRVTKGSPVELTERATKIRYNWATKNTTTSFNFDLSTTMLCAGGSSKPYTPHQSDKKRLLYYNDETQAWEKPILRQWDSIEKHADGKYYYHQRSGEVVLNGSENWRLPVGEEWNNKTLTCSFLLKIDGAKGCSWGSYVPMEFSNKFLNYGDEELYNSDIEGFTTDNLQGNRTFRVLKSKLSTQDVQGFKQWLQANNVTVVYQLAQEKVYECTNIDLITYSGETNYIVESGVLSPKTTLKVHNNISNVVSLLQKKVSLLESNVKASQEVQDMMILETDMRMLDIELALMEFIPMTLNLGGSNTLRSATYFNFLKNHIVNETYEKEYLENVMNKYLATGRINQDEYNELYKMLYPPVYDIELPIEY